MGQKNLKTRFLTTYIGALAVFFGAAFAATLLFVLVLLVYEPAFSAVVHSVAHHFVVHDGAKMRLLIWIVMMLVLLCAVIAIFLWHLNRKVTSPLVGLTLATDKICGGEYDAEIIGADTEEIDALCRSLDGMRLRLKEKADAEEAMMADRSLLIANISHDMRTPVTTIRGYLQAIEEGVAHTPEQIRECYDHIRAKTMFLEHLAADMTEFSDLESGRLRYVFDDVELCGFLEDMAEEYRDETAAKGFSFSCSVPNEKVLLRADRYRLQRVMQNLLSNAIKYNKPGGKIDVTLEVHEPYIYLCVSDSGIGVGGDSLKKVFDSFYREDSSRGSVSGHGLGLAISKQIVEDHHGKIWMQSKNGEGTRVYMCFPLK
ncbi:MAG: HAMP domain-containing histidine kinase [Firmicutes bacterium]|nr:HAMP domain-containing histidine kinase [Bacillota bacterium]